MFYPVWTDTCFKTLNLFVQKSKENPFFHAITVSFCFFSSCIFSHTPEVLTAVFESSVSFTKITWGCYMLLALSPTTPRPLKWSHHQTKVKKNIDSKRKLQHSSSPISVITPCRTLSGESCLIIHVVCSGYWEKDTQQMKSHKS